MRIGGLDVGQLTDHTVLGVLHASRPGAWTVEAIHRLPLCLPFSAQLRALQPHLDRLDHLAFDAGGVGQSLGEHIHGAQLQSLVPVVITGGTSRGKVVNGRVSVSKTALVGSMMDILRRGELVVSPDAPGREILRAEMQSFQYLTNGRFLRMEARPGQHDDAVMALALSVWLARYSSSGTTVETTPSGASHSGARA